MDKMQNAFAPEKVVEEEVTAPTKYMTPDEVEEWYAQKEAAKSQQSEQQKLQDNINNQIAEMTKKWDGTE